MHEIFTFYKKEMEEEMCSGCHIHVQNVKFPYIHFLQAVPPSRKLATDHAARKSILFGHYITCEANYVSYFTILY